MNSLEKLPDQQNLITDNIQACPTFKIVKEVTKVIPIIGKFIDSIDSIIDVIQQSQEATKIKTKEIQIKRKVDSITKILSDKFILQKDISSYLAFTAVQLTYFRKSQIQSQNEITAQFGLFNDKIRLAESYICPLQKQKNKVTYLELSDVSLFLSYFISNSESILNSNSKFKEYTIDLVKINKLEQQLIKTNQQNNKVQVKKSSCYCTIF
ncbi:hypothetical protein ABPG72_018517 [Tetrahymena utriculariae]